MYIYTAHPNTHGFRDVYTHEYMTAEFHSRILSFDIHVVTIQTADNQNCNNNMQRLQHKLTVLTYNHLMVQVDFYRQLYTKLCMCVMMCIYIASILRFNPCNGGRYQLPPPMQDMVEL